MSLFRSRRDRDQGFTILELVIVALIIGILVAIIVPALMHGHK